MRVTSAAVLAVIAAIAGCSGPRVIESHSYRSSTRPLARVGATYYLPRQLVAVEVDRKLTPEEGMQDFLTIWLRPPVADTRRRFYVRMRREDKYILQTTEDGLLTSPGAPSANYVGRELGRFRASTADVSKSCNPVDGLSAAPPATVRPLTATVVFDPTVAADIARAEEELCSRGAHYRFVLSRIGASESHVVMAPVDYFESRRRRFIDGDFERDEQYPGLVYRRAEPFILSVFQVLGGGNDAVEFVSSMEVSLPNAAPIERMALPELAITTQEGVAFQGGMLAARVGPPVPKRRRFSISFSSGNEDSGVLGGASGLLPFGIQTQVKSEPVGVKEAPAE